ncbi:MAG: cyclic nucleotide-binding domain-containing protein [Dissulfuribacterales bacterium]
MEEDKCGLLCPFLKERTLERGDVLFREDDPADYMAFIIEGSLEIKKKTEFADKYIVLSILGAGTFVGEIVLFEYENPVRSATATALDRTQLAILTKERFEAMSQEQPTVCLRLLKSVLKEVVLRLRAVNERMASVF